MVENRCVVCGLMKRKVGDECSYCEVAEYLSGSLAGREYGRIRRRRFYSEHKDERRERQKVLESISPDELLSMIGDVGALDKPLSKLTRKEKYEVSHMKTYKVSIVEYVVASNPQSAREKAMALFGFPQVVLDKVKTLDFEVKRIDGDGVEEKGESQLLPVKNRGPAKEDGDG